jgi:hypothetical protein
MLTLEAPFTAATEVELIFAVRDARKREARSIVPTLPEAIVSVLDRMMERQRTDRYQSGRELARDLRAVLEKISPGYRRGNFSRYMRQTFKDEIEKELRQLEGWVIDEAMADASKVGVNLIADALPADAAYRGFFPASTHSSMVAPPSDASGSAELPAQPTSIFQRAGNDLHAQPTHILRNNPLDERVRGSLHQQSTMMLEGRAADQLLSQVRASLAASPSGLHDHETRILSGAAAEEAATPAPADASEPSVDVSRALRPDSAETDLPAASTRILRSGEALPASQPPPLPPGVARPRHDTKPDSAPHRFDEDASQEHTLARGGSPSDKVFTDFANDDDSGPTNPRGDKD